MVTFINNVEKVSMLKLLGFIFSFNIMFLWLQVYNMHVEGFCQFVFTYFETMFAIWKIQHIQMINKMFSFKTKKLLIDNNAQVSS